jgi:hypothetical protein
MRECAARSVAAVFLAFRRGVLGLAATVSRDGATGVDLIGCEVTLGITANEATAAFLARRSVDALALACWSRAVSHNDVSSSTRTHNE